jgi:hypothetical protein
VVKFTCLCVCMLAALAFAVAPRRAEADDFYTFYDSAAIVASGQIYTTTQHGGRFLPFLRIPSYAWMIRPLAALPYPAARRCWILLLVAAFAGFLFLWPARSPLLALSVTASIPVLFALQLGQDIAFILLIAAVALRLSLTGRHFAAGLVVSLAAIKLTFLAPLALVLIAHSLRSLPGIATGVTAQLLVSFAGTGLDWPRQYLAILRSPGLDPMLTAIPGLRNIASLVPPATALIVIAGLIAGYGLIWTVGKRAGIEQAIAIAIAVGVITAPHALTYDAALCIPLFVTVASMQTWAGRLAALCLTPVPYLLLTTPVRAAGMAGGLMVVAAVAAASVQILDIGFFRRRSTLAGALKFNGPRFTCSRTIVDGNGGGSDCLRRPPS